MTLTIVSYQLQLQACRIHELDVAQQQDSRQNSQDIPHRNAQHGQGILHSHTYICIHTHNVFTHPPTPTCIHPTPTLTPTCIHPSTPTCIHPPPPHVFTPPPTPHVFTPQVPTPTCIHPLPHMYLPPHPTPTCIHQPTYLHLFTHTPIYPPTHTCVHPPNNIQPLSWKHTHAVLNKIQVNINNTYSY